MRKAPVPVLDFGDFLAGSARVFRFVSGVRQALSSTGFFYLRNHEVSRSVIQKMIGVLPGFFVDLPLEVRQKYEYPEQGRQWGYTSPNVETGEHARVADAKHFFHVRREQHLDVLEVPEFMRQSEYLFLDFDVIYNILLDAVALSLGLWERYFRSQTGFSLLRVLHYPAQDNPQTSDERVEEMTPGGNVVGMCASRHTDINMLTLLLADQPGLQLRYEGEWLPMHITDHNVLIVNCGDMLEHLTGGRYKSGEHRVVCEPGRERYSMPFFGHLKETASLVPLHHLGESDLTRFPHRTAGEFLEERLKQIGLYG